MRTHLRYGNSYRQARELIFIATSRQGFPRTALKLLLSHAARQEIRYESHPDDWDRNGDAFMGVEIELLETRHRDAFEIDLVAKIGTMDLYQSYDDVPQAVPSFGRSRYEPAFYTWDDGPEIIPKVKKAPRGR